MAPARPHHGLASSVPRRPYDPGPVRDLRPQPTRPRGCGWRVVPTGNLEQIAGGRGEDGPRIPHHTALLLPEPGNPADANAVRVLVAPSQGGPARMVGYLNREDAIAYRPVIDRLAEGGYIAMCHVTLIGGFSRVASFGVILRIGAPWSLMQELTRTSVPTRAGPRGLLPLARTDGHTTAAIARTAAWSWNRCRRRRRSARPVVSRCTAG